MVIRPTAFLPFLLMLCNAVAAEQKESNTSTLILPEIVVVGRNVDELSAGISYGITDLEDMQTWNATTAAEALFQTPGVNVQYGGSSGEARAWVRGFRDRSVLILYDGIPIASAFEGTIDLNEVATASISRIVNIRSAPSVIYGTNGIGGVIDFIPKSGFERRTVQARLEVGGDSSRYAEVSLQQPWESKDFFISASHNEADDYQISDDFNHSSNQNSGNRTNSEFVRKSLFTRFSNDSEKWGKSSFFINISDNERGIPPQAGVSDADYETMDKSKRTTIGLSHQFSQIPLSLKLFRNEHDFDLIEFTDVTYSTIDEIDHGEDYSYGGKAYSHIEIGDRNLLVLSASVINEVYEANRAFLDDGNKAELQTYNLALEDEWQVTDNLTLSLGGIYTYFNGKETKEHSTAFNPQFIASYSLNDNLVLRASATQRTRFPKLRELYRRKYGNPSLKEEEADGYEFGLRWNHNGLTIDIALFHTELDGQIDRPDRNSLYTNRDETEIDGYELSTHGWLNEKVYLGFGYTRARNEEKLAGGRTRQIRSRPEHSAFAEVRYRFNNNAQLAFHGIYVDGLHDLDEFDIYTEVSSYAVGHLKFSYPLTETATAYAAISNVLDKDYEQKLGYPREGRNFRIGLRLSF